MIVVDNARKARGGAGRPIYRRRLHGQGLTNQINNSKPGIEVVAIDNRK